MARNEARIFTSIWRDPHFLSLEEGPQRLYMFLLSQDDLTYCGVLPLRPPRWAKKASGLTVEVVETHLKSLEGTAYPTANPDPESAATPLVVIDWDTGELLARSLMRRDGIWKQPNLLKLAMESAGQVESPRIRAALLAELGRLPLDETGSEQVKTLVADFIAGLKEGGPYPTPYPPPDPADYPSGDPTGEDYAHARGLGERNGSSEAGSPIPLSPVPLSLSIPSGRDRKLGSRLPEPFLVTADMKTWFARHCPHVKAQAEHEQFLDHWRGKPGKDGRKVDWVATWRNWMRTAENRAMPRQRGPTGRQQETDGLFERAAQRITARGGAA